jgi:hypothetical protein
MPLLLLVSIKTALMNYCLFYLRGEFKINKVIICIKYH